MIRYAEEGDLSRLRFHDRHIAPDELGRVIAMKRVLVMFRKETFIGWLRYSLFWDDLPFLNMLYFFEEYRGKGYGGQLVRYWEQEMAEAGHREVLTSTLSSERGQFFFRENGYVDCGSLLLPGGPLEIILRKTINDN